MLQSALSFIKKEKVLSISIILAFLSAFFVHPDKKYISYIDFRVLSILFCLMLVVKGFQNIGLFDLLIEKVFGNITNTRKLFISLIWLCFFLSMLITNDVALITFVPFTILVLKSCNQEKNIIPVIVIQTIAANLGSMGTPVGNPQNLYLFSTSMMSTSKFFSIMLPLTVFCFVVITFFSFVIFPKENISFAIPEKDNKLETKELCMYILLFVINILVVLRVITWIPAFFITIIGILLLQKANLFKEADYVLLLTFVGFFIFVGNLGRIDFIHDILNQLLSGREILISVLFSQFLSNVPAALLLSGFTDNFPALLIGVNIGGLGTLIASMASLISYKLYSNEHNADTGKYIKTFTLYSVIGLIISLIFILALPVYSL